MSSDQAPASKKFGTFLGVYTPSILTILGLIMYLRFGWVLGNVGLGLTILIVIVASSITFITGLSASAIATNIQVGVGGEYFLVSRSLGLEPGGAIGIPLYLCRTLSVTFYCFGLAEAILVFWPELPAYSIQVLAAVFIIIVTALSGKSATLTLKSQIPIMILVGLSILALIIGVFSHELRTPEWSPTYRTAPEGFWYVFAVFFPAVTGFTAGIGLSGDLRDPRKSIPLGTIGAVVSGLAIYLLIPVLLSVSDILSFEQLADPTAGVSIWTDIALFGSILVIPAVWGAILSSAFGSILGGPRVLQALSMDGLAPKFLSQLSKTGQPTVATWISGIIALAAVFLGNLNTVAQFVSVLFLTLYIAINLSAAIETLVAEPSYRPRIKIPWYISMLGALGAIGVMYLINPLACLLSLGLELLLLFWLFSRSLEQKWGDVVAGFWMLMTRFSLLKLSQRSIHARNWRPMLLLFVKNLESRMELVKLAEAMGQNHGILTIVRLITDQPDLNSQGSDLLEKEMLQKLKRRGLSAFCEVHKVMDLEEGILE
ncbi:MAG: amino acid permease, partial [Saprospiraceae bacterium]|nr:amino acid permease [Saprospiraceae bacterium]